MKILMVNKFLYPNGGSETYVFKLGEELVRQGHQVEYFGMEHPDNCVTNTAGAYTEQMDFHNAGALKKLKLSLKTIYSKEARQKIRLVLDNFKPNVVHINNFNYQLTPSIILEIRKWEKESDNKVKIVYTAHDAQLVCPNHMLKNPVTNELCDKCICGDFTNCTKDKCVHGSTMKSVIGTIEAMYWNKKNVYNQLDLIICCSRFLKSKLDSNPVLKSKTIALHNSIDNGRQTEFDKKNYILYFGRFSEEKGIRTLVEACRELPEINFIFAGKGPLEDSVNSVDNIENVGFKSGGELHKLIAQATASLCPSECYENCPLSVMESISLGTPVIGAKIGGVPELIEDGKTGLLFNSGDTEQLKKAILSVCTDSDKAKQMAIYCKNAEFDTHSTYTEKILELYGE